MGVDTPQVFSTTRRHFFKIHRIADQESSTIIRGINEGWIHRHGPPDYMMSGQGSNVDGTEVKEH